MFALVVIAQSAAMGGMCFACAKYLGRTWVLFAVASVLYTASPLVLASGPSGNEGTFEDPIYGVVAVAGAAIAVAAGGACGTKARRRRDDWPSNQ